MSTQSNAIPGSVARAQGITSVLPAARLIYWSVRRELWEYRSIYVAPVAVAAVLLFAFWIGPLHLLWGFQITQGSVAASQRLLLRQPYTLAEDLVMGTAIVIAGFYSIDALHGERRDRSILFWKSLPVSDLTTVLSKAIVPIVLVPLIAFGTTAATQAVMLLISSAVWIGSGHRIWDLWSQIPIFRMWLMLLFHFFCIHGLWQSPIYGWLLLISAWARRAPILWAVLPPLAIGIGEKLAFNTTYFGSLIGSRFTGGPEGSAIMEHGRAMDTASLFTPAHFLVNPGLWIGFVLTAAFLATAVRVRRSRGPV